MEFCGCTFLSGVITANVFYSPIYQPNLVLKYEKEMYIYIPTDATFEDVPTYFYQKAVLYRKLLLFDELRQKRYIHRIKAGRYLLKNGMNNNELVNLLRSGRQTPVNVIFNNLRTKEQFAGTIAKQLELDSLSLLTAITDASFLNPLGLNDKTVVTLFIPNTYEFYWDVPIDKFLARMTAEHFHFGQMKKKINQKD